MQKIRGNVLEALLWISLGVLLLVGVACGPGVWSAIALTLGGGGGGGGSDTTMTVEVDPQDTLPHQYGGALVIPNEVQIANVELTQNSVMVPIDPNVPPTHQALLGQELMLRGIFDPQTEYLRFFRTVQPIVAQPGAQFTLRLTQSEGGNPVQESRIGGGGTRLDDLADGPPLTLFQGHDNPFAAFAVPLAHLAVLLAAALALVSLGAGLLRSRRKHA